MSAPDVGALLVERAGLLERIEAIDADLARAGVRAIQTVVGRPREVAGLIFATLATGPKTAKEIQAATGQGMHACHQTLSKMVLAGELRRLGRGVYALPVQPARRAEA